MPVTDYYRQIRRQVLLALKAALAAEQANLEVVELDDEPSIDISLPTVAVWYGGSEGYVGGTNRRDDVAYPFAIGLFTLEADGPAGDPPGLHPTRFREVVRQTFGNRRAVAVSGIDCYLCQYEPGAPVVDADGRPFQSLRTAAGVTVYARVPRGS